MAAARLLWDAQRPDADRIDFDRIDRVSLDGWLRMGDVLLQMAVARDDARTSLARVEAERDDARKDKAAFFDELGAVLESLNEDPDGAPYAQEAARKMRNRAENAEAENKRMREALGFYADEGNYCLSHPAHGGYECCGGGDEGPIIEDRGSKARAALAKNAGNTTPTATGEAVEKARRAFYEAARKVRLAQLRWGEHLEQHGEPGEDSACTCHANLRGSELAFDESYDALLAAERAEKGGSGGE